MAPNLTLRKKTEPKQCPLGTVLKNDALFSKTVPLGRIGALLQKGTKIVPQRALFYGPSNGTLRAPFWYRLFLSVQGDFLLAALCKLSP